MTVILVTGLTTMILDTIQNMVKDARSGASSVHTSIAGDHLETTTIVEIQMERTSLGVIQQDTENGSIDGTIVRSDIVRLVTKVSENIKQNFFTGWKIKSFHSVLQCHGYLVAFNYDNFIISFFLWIIGK